MSNESVVGFPHQIILGSTSDLGDGSLGGDNYFPATAANRLHFEVGGSPSPVPLLVVNGNTASVASGDTGYQFPKFKLPNPIAPYYTVTACAKFESAPSAGGKLHCFASFSDSDTAANGNGNGITGAGGVLVYDDSVRRHLQDCGGLTLQNIQTNKGFCGIMVPDGTNLVLCIKLDSSVGLHAVPDDFVIALKAVWALPNL